MINKIDKFLSTQLLIIITILLLITTYFIYNEPSNFVKEIKHEETTIKQDNKIDIKYLQKKYNNTDIIAYIEIPDIISFPIVKTTNNDYYLNNNLYKEEDVRGTLFMDYRTNIEDKKVLIYGHSGKEEGLPFNELVPYKEESYYKKHPTIYLYTENNKYTYDIFSSYFEGEDFDYVNINSFNGLTYQEHLNKLKNKSMYNIDISLEEDSKILILQTCNLNVNSKDKYQLVIGKQTKKE